MTTIANNLASGVEIPDAFYELTLDELPGGGIDISSQVIDHEKPAGGSYEARKNTVTEIEKLTGIDFPEAFGD